MSTQSQPLTGHDRCGDPCIFVIFGASGDLTKRKLLPALYNLRVLGLLPEKFAIVGVATTEYTDESFRAQSSKDIHEFATRDVDDSVWENFEKHSYYVQGDFNDTNLFKTLQKKLDEVGKALDIPANYLFYLAVAPRFFATVAKQLGNVGLTNEEANWRRVIIEKPFGHDLSSARSLNSELKSCLLENQVYRIDHYLGKETVQNIMAFRFGNSIYEPIWNRRYIDTVQITVAEKLGVEQRGGYYDQSGVLRDMVQNHMLSVLSLVCMEPPSSITGDSVRNEKVKVLEAIRLMTPEKVLEDTVRGQYGEGRTDGNDVPAYRTEADVDPNSNTETYAALKLEIDNWRWADVPVYLRSGKRLADHTTEVVITFKRAPLMLFGEQATTMGGPNRLVLHIQPTEGVTFDIHAKRPGPNVVLASVPLNFNYSVFGEETAATGYETLLYDCMVGDMTLFHRYDSVDRSWEICTPILDVWHALPARDFPNYASGSWGPFAADQLLARDGHKWHYYPRPNGV